MPEDRMGEETKTKKGSGGEGGFVRHTVLRRSVEEKVPPYRKIPFDTRESAGKGRDA